MSAPEKPDTPDWRERMCERLHGADCGCGRALAEARQRVASDAALPRLLYCSHWRTPAGHVCADCGQDPKTGEWLAPELRGPR